MYQRLESMIGNLMENIEACKKEEDFTTAAVIARHALSLYSSFTEKHPAPNHDLGYSLLLENTKIAAVRTLRELYGGDEKEVTLCDAIAGMMSGERAMLHKNFVIGMTEKTKEFAAGSFGDYAPLVDGAILATGDSQIDVIMRALDLLAPDMSSDLKEEFRKWFGYLKAIGNYFGCILGEYFPGCKDRYKFTERDAETLRKFIVEIAVEEIPLNLRKF